MFGSLQRYKIIPKGIIPNGIILKTFCFFCPHPSFWALTAMELDGWIHVELSVYIFYDKRKSNLSAMLNGNLYFTIIPYETEEGVYPSIDKIFNRDR